MPPARQLLVRRNKLSKAYDCLMNKVRNKEIND